MASTRAQRQGSQPGVSPTSTERPVRQPVSYGPEGAGAPHPRSMNESGTPGEVNQPRVEVNPQVVTGASRQGLEQIVLMKCQSMLRQKRFHHNVV